jgi:glycerol-3-phosphate dehydrogenase (NAD(P)+)
LLFTKYESVLKNNPSVAVIGGGSWASAIVKMLTNNLDRVNWWMRNEKSVDHLKKYHHNPKYLQSVEYNMDKINVSTDLKEIIDSSQVLVMATPSAFIANMFDDYPRDGMDKKIIISAIKGIVPEFNAIPARYFHKTFRIPYEQIGMISGPCHAEEVALERLSYITVACPDQDIAANFAKMLDCRYIKTSISDDLFGTELSAVLKNVYAIASGIYSGLGYGDNFQAVLVSNAIQEAERFIDAVNPIHRDVLTSAYLGDLLVTAYSKFSRNRTFGFMIGKGYSVNTAQLEMDMIAEGYYAVKSIMAINEKFDVDLPICQAVYHVIYEKISPVIEMNILADKLS